MLTSSPYVSGAAPDHFVSKPLVPSVKSLFQIRSLSSSCETCCLLCGIQNADILRTGQGPETRALRRNVFPKLKSCTLDVPVHNDTWDEVEMVYFLTHPTLTSLTVKGKCIAIHDTARLAQIRGISPAQIIGSSNITELILDECDLINFTLERMIQLPRELVRLHIAYRRLGPYPSTWHNERLPKVFQSIERHRHSLEDLLVSNVYMTRTRPCFLQFPKLRKLDLTVDFTLRHVSSESECLARDWSDMVGPNVEDFKLRAHVDLPAFCAIIRLKKPNTSDAS